MVRPLKTQGQFEGKIKRVEGRIKLKRELIYRIEIVKCQEELRGYLFFFVDFIIFFMEVRVIISGQ